MFWESRWFSLGGAKHRQIDHILLSASLQASLKMSVVSRIKNTEKPEQASYREYCSTDFKVTTTWWLHQLIIYLSVFTFSELQLYLPFPSHAGISWAIHTVRISPRFATYIGIRYETPPISTCLYPNCLICGGAKRLQKSAADKGWTDSSLYWVSEEAQIVCNTIDDIIYNLIRLFMPSTASSADCHRFISTWESQFLFNIKVLFAFLVETLKFLETHLSLRCLALLMDCSQKIVSLKRGEPWCFFSQYFHHTLLSCKSVPVGGYCHLDKDRALMGW